MIKHFDGDVLPSTFIDNDIEAACHTLIYVLPTYLIYGFYIFLLFLTMYMSYIYNIYMYYNILYLLNHCPIDISLRYD